MKLELVDLGNQRPTLAYQFGGFVGAMAAVTLSTFVGLLISERWGNEPVVLLYLPSVLAAAVYAGLWPALASAVASAMAYNYFFTAPYRTFVIHNPADVVTVIVLFLVALVTSQLVGLLRQQAQLAAAHAARNATIAGFARKLLSSADEQAIAHIAVSELSQLFRCHVVLITGEDRPQVLASAPPAAALAPSDFAAAAITLHTGEPTGRGVRKLDLADWQFRAVASDRAVMAALGVAREDGALPIADDQLGLYRNLLDQVALAMARARLEVGARDVAALRERDRLRSALLTSIGEDVKPRLNAIGAAARALKRAGAGDKALITSVSAEIAKLDRYIDGLIDLAPGAELEPFICGSLTIDLHRRTVSRAGTDIHLTPKEYALLVELARNAGRVLTHGHLLRAVWGPAQSEQLDYLRVAIRALRQKLEADPAHPALILNEPAVGYRLASDSPPA